MFHPKGVLLEQYYCITNYEVESNIRLAIMI